MKRRRQRLLFALGDLHLSHSVQKPMDIFGSVWENHAAQISQNWISTVTDEDTVLLPGDLSWAMTLNEAIADLHWLDRLPGKQIMIRGNHDYWWSGIGRVRSQLSDKQIAIQNDAVVAQDYAVCGSRGWLLPSHPKFQDSDEAIFRRETERLRLSLEVARQFDRPIIVMLHYPPCSDAQPDTAFTQLLEAYSVRLCIYGHLHGPAHRFAFEGSKNGVVYRLVSADYLGFKPLPLEL
jgi:predicted phosphohydrolase